MPLAAGALKRIWNVAWMAVPVAILAHDVIAFLCEENRVLKTRLVGRRLRL